MEVMGDVAREKVKGERNQYRRVKKEEYLLAEYPL